MNTTTEKSPPVPGWESIRTKAKVSIPKMDGKTIDCIIEVEIDAWRDPATGEIFLDAAATDELDRVKARHMGLFTPEELHTLRSRLKLSQKMLSELLQIGEKSWTRWETGHERPSRSINLLIRALHDGRIDVPYLRAIQGGTQTTATPWSRLLASSATSPVFAGFPLPRYNWAANQESPPTSSLDEINEATPAAA